MISSPFLHEARNLMGRYVTKGTQALFFPGMKVPTQKKWLDRLEEFGTIKRFWVNRGGGRLSCVEIIPPDFSENAGYVIFAHPISRKAKFFFGEGKRIRAYLGSGYKVILFDFNGFGESDSLDLFYWKDALTVVESIKARGDCARIVLHGVSFGSFHMIRSISSLPTGATVVFENTSRSLFDYWKRWFHTRSAVQVLELLSIPAIKDMRVKGVLAGLDRDDLRFVWMACGDDKYTPASEMRDLATNLKSSHQTWVDYPGAAHLGAADSDPAKYEEAIAYALRVE